MTPINIGGYIWHLPTNYKEVTELQLNRVADNLSPRNVLSCFVPRLPVKVLSDDVVLTCYTILQWVEDEPLFTPTKCPPADDWTWQQLEEVRELIAGNPRPWLNAYMVADALGYNGRNKFEHGLTAITLAIEFLNRFELVFEGELTEEQKEAGADALLQFKYYTAANRLAEIWHMTPQRVLQEKAGDCYLKMLYDITKSKIDDNLQKNHGKI
jgi:hypothetical protein